MEASVRPFIPGEVTFYAHWEARCIGDEVLTVGVCLNPARKSKHCKPSSLISRRPLSTPFKVVLKLMEIDYARIFLSLRFFCL
jgi:hypothetical protein